MQPMHLHAVNIPAANSDEDVTAALTRAGTFAALGAEGVSLAFAPAMLPPSSANPVADVANLGTSVADNVRDGLVAGRPVLVLGGNCNVLPGVLGGFQRAYGPGVRVGLVWFDAHGDFNTPKTTITGRLGGMPVAVAAGLCFPSWRESAGMTAPLPTNRIVMVDVRNLDPKERTLIEATEVTIAAAEPGREGVSLEHAVHMLARDCDMIYLHIDEDILDRRYVPNHGTAENDGPDMAAVKAAIRVVLCYGQSAGLRPRVGLPARGRCGNEPRICRDIADGGIARLAGDGSQLTKNRDNYSADRWADEPRHVLQ